MSDSISRLRQARPEQIAGLVQAIGARVRLWGPEELAAVFRHQMRAPISVELQALGKADEQSLQVIAEDGGLGLKSFADLFQHPHPPLELLQMVKEFAKRNCRHAESALPKEVATALYFLSIGAAIVRLDERISALSDPELCRGFRLVLEQPWVDSALRELLSDALKALEPPQELRRRVD